MANSYKTTTNVWVVDSTGTLNTGGVTIDKIYWVPGAAAHDLVLTDNADNAFISLKADPSAAIPIDINFIPPRRMPSLKVGTIDGGTAYIFFHKTDF